MLIKGPIKIKTKGYTVYVEDIDIAPADYSVGIMTDYLEGYIITHIYNSYL